MKIALVQLSGDDITQFRKTSDKITMKIKEACQNKVDFIVLPECAFPSYLLGYDKIAMKDALDNTSEFLDRVASLAAKFKVYIAIGVAIRIEGKLYNATIVYNRSGEIINKSTKSFLWHFDDKWFEAGEVAEVFDTEFGRIGVMICADGRIPEVARILKLRGADLIIDPVNLAANASTPEQLSNQQFEFILESRARENDVYIVACDKCGVEANMVTFLGRSIVLDREGNKILQCSPDKEEIAICDIDLRVTSKIDNRRPELYGELTNNTESLETTKKINKKYKLDELALYTMVIRFQYDNKEEYVNQAIHYLKGSELMNSTLIILPELRRPHIMDEIILSRIQEQLSGSQTVVIAGNEHVYDGLTKKALVITADKILGEIQCTHSKKLINANEIKVVEISHTCSLSVVFDEEINIPEISRVAMLKGADILVSYDNKDNNEWYNKMLKTRAAENKIFVIKSSSSEKPNTSMIINPDGGIVSTTFMALDHASLGYINTALSKFKNIVPGTNVVSTRKPSIYREMI